MAPQPEFIQARLRKAVRRYIDDAIQARALISTSQCAEEILQTYPACPLGRRAIEDEVLMAAAKAGVAVTIGDPQPASVQRNASKPTPAIISGRFDAP